MLYSFLRKNAIMLAVAIQFMAVGTWLFSGSRSPARSFPLIDPQNSCGPVSVSLITNLIGTPKTLKDTKPFIKVDALGRTSMQEIVQGLKQIGYEACGARIPKSNIGKLKCPFIIFLDSSHFAVAYGLAGRRLLLIDPPSRTQIVALSDLASAWQGEVVLVAKSPREMTEQIIDMGLSR